MTIFLAGNGRMRDRTSDIAFDGKEADIFVTDRIRSREKQNVHI